MLQREAVATGTAAKVDGDRVEGFGQDKGEVVLKRLGGVGIAQRQVGIGAQVAPPVKLQITGFESAVMQRAVHIASKADTRLNLQNAQAHLKLVASHGPQIGAKVDAVDAVVPVGAFEAIVAPAVDAKPVAGIVLAPAKAGANIAHAVFTRRHARSQAPRIGGVARDDVDDSQKRTGSVRRRVGAAQHLDSFNVCNGHRLQTRRNAAKQERGIRRAAINQHLNTPGVDTKPAVVAGLRRISLKRSAALKSGHQQQQVGNVPGTDKPDHRAVQYGHSPGRLVQPLWQARY